jgi:hypothetical protein
MAQNAFIAVIVGARGTSCGIVGRGYPMGLRLRTTLVR